MHSVRASWAAGLVIGAFLAGASWIGNSDPHQRLVLSSFPDLLTLFVLPVGTYFVIRARRAREPDAGIAPMRRAGWAATEAAAITYAIFIAAVTVWAGGVGDAASVAFVLASTLLVAAAIGVISTEVWARLFAAIRRTPRAGDRPPPSASGGHA